MQRSELYKINAVKRVKAGEAVIRVAKEVGTSSSVIYGWIKAFESGLIGKNMTIEKEEEKTDINSGEVFALRKENLKLKRVINLLLENVNYE